MIYRIMVREGINYKLEDDGDEDKVMTVERDPRNTNGTLSFNRGRRRTQVDIKKLHRALQIIGDSTEITVDVDDYVSVRRYVNKFNESVVYMVHNSTFSVMLFSALYAAVNTIASNDI